MPENENQIEVVVEYDGFIAGRELAEIIEVLDEALWYEIEDAFFPFPPRPLSYRYFRWFDQPPPPLFCVSEAGKGSLLLTGFIGGAAITYCYSRFKRGFRRSRFGVEVEHLGRALGDNLGGIIGRMNRWLDEYAADAKDKGSRIKSISARPRRRRRNSDENRDSPSGPES